MKVYEINEIKDDSYYSLQQERHGQWMYCSGSYSCVKGSEIPAILEKEKNAKYADPTGMGEWRIVECN